MKKTILVLTLAIFLVATLSACGTSAPATPVVPAESAPVDSAPAGATLGIDHPDAANIRSQLAYGLLQLEGTSLAPSAEQARLLIPLWQAVIALSGTETTASEELVAVQDQIIQTLAPDQVGAIVAMKVSNSDLQAYYAQFGIVLPTPIPGVTKVPGSGSGKTEAERAASQATAVASGQTTGSGQSAKMLLFDHVIEMLGKIAG